MALGDNTGGHTFLNIKEGKVSYKDKKTNEKKTCDFVEGTITGVKFEIKEWEGKKYEQVSVDIIDGEDKYILQMKTNSGYFRAFCNCLKSGDTSKRTKFTPTYSEDGASKSSGMFVNQQGDAKSLSWYSTKKDPKDVPQLKPVTFNGETKWDSTEQLKYWRDWLSGIKWNTEFEASSHSQPSASNTTVTAITPVQSENSGIVSDDDGDLPF